jgi:hypothetical protein
MERYQNHHNLALYLDNLAEENLGNGGTLVVCSIFVYL